MLGQVRLSKPEGRTRETRDETVSGAGISVIPASRVGAGWLRLWVTSADGLSVELVQEPDDAVVGLERSGHDDHPIDFSKPLLTDVVFDSCNQSSQRLGAGERLLGVKAAGPGGHGLKVIDARDKFPC